MKKTLIFVLPLLIIFSHASFASTKGASVIMAPPAKKALKKAPAKKKPRILKYVAPPSDGLRVENVPLSLPISDDAVTYLSRGKLKDAVRILKSDAVSAKSLHLLREIQRILSYNDDRKVAFLDLHRLYQNEGVAYHNLFLFLKAKGITQKKYFKSAVKFYKKAAKEGSSAEEAEAGVLLAALYAANDEIEKAKEIFSDVDVTALENDFKTSEYLAGYYASVGDAADAVKNLKDAARFRPEQTSIWVAISDDYYRIKDSAEFKEMQESFAKTKPAKEAVKKPAVKKKKKRVKQPMPAAPRQTAQTS